MSDTQEFNDPEQIRLSKELLMAHLNEAVGRMLPDFQQNMPADYFHAVGEVDQIAHLSTLATTGLAGIDQNLLLTSNHGQCYTFINRKNYSGLLSELLSQLPKDKPLLSAKIFTSNKGDVVIDIFDFAPQRQFEASNPVNRERLDQLINSITEFEPSLAMEDLIGLLHACSEDYVLTTSDRRLCRHFKMVQSLWGNDDVKLESLTHSGDNYTDVTIGFGHGDTRHVFERICAYFGRHHIDIHRAHFETFQNDKHERVSLIGLLISNPDGSPINTSHPEWQQHLTHLQRLPMLCDETLALYFDPPGWELNHAELLTALAHLVHQRLCKIDPYRYSLERISQVLIKHRTMTCTIFDALLRKFAPEQPDIFDAAELLDEDDLLALPESDTTIIKSLHQAAQCIFKTNVYFTSRYALAFRIDPAYLCVGDREIEPHGVFFIYGKNFIGFHVRFRDIARGGMRIVRPRNWDDYHDETVHLYDENYGLAYAQQLKNKDIPEGGSKGVLLIKPQADHEQCGRAYADSLLDLITPTEQNRSLRVDYYGVDELLYLGPDENVSPQLINWIIQRAHSRHYPMPNTFMSSKSATGINHKVYGVTSEGITVFLDAALRHGGIDPAQQPFTVKITGGPDGDVAGNEILILHREYGNNAKITGIADGSGTAEDPDGLDHKELIRLVKANAPITHFNPDMLGHDGRITTVDTPEGVHARNTLHFRLISDAFVPAGGRPQAINALNWNHFLRADGTPCSRIIVEGANLFITDEARKHLSAAGVLIIKDSSANKCGVICSSLEIIAGMLTTEPQFSAIKSLYVEQTLTRLRKLAELEARALFRAHTHHPHLTLPEISMQMSIQINRLHDAIASMIRTPAAEDLQRLRQLVEDYIPAVLVATVGKQAVDSIPAAYTQQIVASVLASQIVYNEGIDYCRHMNNEQMAQLALIYLHHQEDLTRLVQTIEASDLAQKQRIIALLKAGGAGAALKL